MEWPTPSKNALVGHYIFDSGTKIRFAPTVFMITLLRRKFLFEERTMYEYQRLIKIKGELGESSTLLRAIRLPGSWYAVVWEHSKRYASMSQDVTERNGVGDMTDDEFLFHVQRVFWFIFGIDFIYPRVA